MAVVAAGCAPGSPAPPRDGPGAATTPPVVTPASPGDLAGVTPNPAVPAIPTDPSHPTNSSDPAVPNDPADPTDMDNATIPRSMAAKPSVGRAPIEAVEVQPMESVPTEVTVVVRGYLPDGCTKLGDVTQRFDAARATFYVTVSTTRPAGAMCIQVITPFERAVPLDVAGLPGGTYAVDVNGMVGAFTLGLGDGAPF